MVVYWLRYNKKCEHPLKISTKPSAKSVALMCGACGGAVWRLCVPIMPALQADVHPAAWAPSHSDPLVRTAVPFLFSFMYSDDLKYR